jgi:hypothetical protein
MFFGGRDVALLFFAHSGKLLSDAAGHHQPGTFRTAYAVVHSVCFAHALRLSLDAWIRIVVPVPFFRPDGPSLLQNCLRPGECRGDGRTAP